MWQRRDQYWHCRHSLRAPDSLEQGVRDTPRLFVQQDSDCIDRGGDCMFLGHLQGEPDKPVIQSALLSMETYCLDDTLQPIAVSDLHELLRRCIPNCVVVVN